MNIVVGSSYVIHGASTSVVISIFSLERNELINTFSIDVIVPPGCIAVVVKLRLASEGQVVLHMNVVDSSASIQRSIVAAYSLMGQLLGSTDVRYSRCAVVLHSPSNPEGILNTPTHAANSCRGVDGASVISDDTDYSSVCESQLVSVVTYMATPAHTGVVLTGHEDGTVCIWSAHNMALVHMFAPHETYQRCATQSSGDNSGLGKMSASPVLYVATIVYAKAIP